jgi:hypothetical protein
MKIMTALIKTGRQFFGITVLLGAIFICSGCRSKWVTIAPELPGKYEQLGLAEAEACGDLYFFTTPTQVVPHNWNERVQKAYDGALASVPGATALMNVNYSERWYWWGLAFRRCARISAEAIR